MATDITKEIAHWDAAASADTTTLHKAIYGAPNLDAEWHRKTMDYVLRWMPDRGTILDLGCGIGRMAIPIAKSRPDAEVIGLDISTAMLDLARDANANEPTENITFITGDGVHIPDHALNAAYSVAVFQHLPVEVVKGYLQEVAAKLVTGGEFVFQFVRGDYSFFLSQGLPVVTVSNWCKEFGLDIIQSDVDYPLKDWVWFVTRKV